MSKINIVGKIVIGVFTIAVVSIGGMVGYLCVNEYKPEEIEKVEINNTASKILKSSETITVMTYNVGYCALSSDMDFFMDGGERVRPESKEIIERNIQGVSDRIAEINPDIVFLQEVDKDSKRSYGIDQVAQISDNFNGNFAFAKNFSCKYIPYPLKENIGSVEGGLVTLSSFNSEDGKRYALPTSFKWPFRVCQLKRCLLTERIPIENSDKELVIVNLHLEAYDDGSAKTAQTEILISFIKEEYEKGNYVIAGGDFNQNFPGVDYNKYPIINSEYFMPGILESGLLDENWTWAVDGETPSSRLLNEEYDQESENTQLYVIDGFILSPNISLESVETIDSQFDYSDHNPVVLKVNLK